MIVNPDKFQAIILDKKNSNLTKKGSAIDSQQIKTASTAGHLGIQLNDKFNFNYHVSNNKRSATNQLRSWSTIKTENKNTFLTLLHS